MKEILRSLRNQNNYSQNAVADYLEISRQMYNKYENGSAEPSVKNIKKLCELYKVSADVFFNEKEVQNKEQFLYPDISKSDCYLSVASPSVSYGSSSSLVQNKTNLLDKLINLLPDLKLTEQISLMSKLAALIENQTCSLESKTAQPVIKQKKIKKIPDAEYNSYFKSEEAKKISEAGLATVREILKNDEW